MWSHQQMYKTYIFGCFWYKMHIIILIECLHLAVY